MSSNFFLKSPERVMVLTMIDLVLIALCDTGASNTRIVKKGAENLSQPKGQKHAQTHDSLGIPVFHGHSCFATVRVATPCFKYEC